MKEPASQNTNRSPPQQPNALEGAAFSRSEHRVDSPPLPPLTNAQITLQYRAHREIIRAIIADDKAALRSTWERYQDIDIRGEDALSMCLELKRLDLVGTLLDLGARPDKLRSSNLAPLVRNRNIDILKRLVEAGAPVNNESGDSEALGYAIQAFSNYIERRIDTSFSSMIGNDRSKPFDFSTIQFLLEHGAGTDATRREIKRSTISTFSEELQWLASHLTDLLSLFERHGVPLRTDRLDGCCSESADPVPPLEQAIEKGDVAKVNELLTSNPELLSLVTNPLSKAVLSDSRKMVQYLLDRNCDVNEAFGKPLLYACSKNQFIFDPFYTPGVVRLLLERGADPTIRDADAFIHACRKFTDTLGPLFFEKNSVRDISAQNDAALRGLLRNSDQFPELGLVRSLNREEPAIKHLTMVKSLVERGADPYTAMLYELRTPSLTPPGADRDVDWNSPTSHYKPWGDFLRERLSQQQSTNPHTLDDCHRTAEGFLRSTASLMQLGNDSNQRGTIASLSGRYCHLMAQVLEPTNSCWINSLISSKERKIPEATISPSLLKHDSRYKMVSDVAAIATVLYRPSVLRHKFIDLASATFSDTVRLKDSQQTIEKMFEWVSTTNRMQKHFADMVLLPALLAHIKPEALPYLTRGVLRKVRKDLRFVATETLLDGRSLREIRDFTKRWHALSDRHPIPISLNDGWNSILQQPLSLPNGFIVEDMNSCKQLREVGRQMKNCLGDGVHATECFYGLSRILTISKDGLPIVAMTLEKTEDGWHLTEYEGPNYTRPEEGPDAPLSHFKAMLATNKIQFKGAYKNSIRSPQEDEDDGVVSKYHTYLENNHTDIGVAIQAPGINAAAFYQRWVVIADKASAKKAPLLTDAAIPRCLERLREMAEAVSLYLQYSEALYKSYPR